VFLLRACLTCLLLLVPLAGQDKVRLQAPGFSDRVQIQVERDAERAMEDVEKRLGWTLARPVEFRLVRTVSDLPEGLQASFVGRTVAVTLTHEYQVFLVRERLSSAPPDDLRSTLVHEFVHSALGDMEIRLSGGSKRLPPWLHEGMAQWVAGAGFYPGGEGLLYSSADWGRLLSWTDLGRRFPTDLEDRQLAYAQSLSFFNFLESRFGMRTLLQVVQDYLEGKSKSLGGALYRLENNTIVEMEVMWKEWVISNAGLLGLVKRRLFDLLLLLTVPLLFLVLRRRNRREQEADDRLDDHEEEMAWEDGLERDGDRW
jgi:Peptidase MA superfamily